MNERHCSQCDALGYRPKSYCKPFCKRTGEDIKVDVFRQKPHGCPKEVHNGELSTTLQPQIEALG